MRGRDLLFFGSTGLAKAGNVIASFIADGKPAVYYDALVPGGAAVNSDGTGGAPTLDTAFGAFVDLGGGGVHATQATATLQPTLSNDGALFAQKDYPTWAGGLVRSCTSLAVVPGTTQNCTFVIIADCNSLPVDLLPSASITCVARNSTNYPVSKVCIVGKLSPSGVEIRVNNTVYTQGAIAAAALRAVRIGVASVADKYQNDAQAFYCAAYFNSVFSTQEFNALHTYAMARSKANTLNSGVVVIKGDSIYQGVRTQGRWMARSLAKTINEAVYNVAQAGDGWVLQNNLLDSVLPRFKGVGTNVCLIKMGVNDPGQMTGNQTNDGNFCEQITRAECRYAESVGFSTIVTPTVYLSGSTSVFMGVLNAALKANYNTYADGFVDLLALSGWTADVHYLDSDSDRELAALLPVYNAVIFAPKIKFTRTTAGGVAPVVAGFTDTSTNSPTSRLWTLTGGTPSSSALLSPAGVTYPAGSYDVKLESTNGNGTGVRIMPNAIISRASLAPSSANRVGWFKKGVGQSAGSWVNQDAGFFDLTQATAGNQPVINGTGTLTFDGVSDFLQSAVVNSTILPAAFTVMLRMRVVAFGSNKAVIDGGVANCNYLQQDNVANSMYHNCYGTVTKYQGFVTGTWHTIYFGFMPITGMRVQACQVDTGPLTTTKFYAGSIPPTKLTIGSRYNGTANSNIEVAEILVYSAPPSDLERAENAIYLATVI